MSLVIYVPGGEGLPRRYYVGHNGAKATLGARAHAALFTARPLADTVLRHLVQLHPAHKWRLGELEGGDQVRELAP